MSLIVYRARTTLPCQQNHLRRCRPSATAAAGSAGGGRPSSSGGAARRLLAMLVMTVRRMVTWNQSSRCSESGLRYSGRSRTLSPPSVRKVTAWLACMPGEMSRSNRRRLGLVSSVWTEPEALGRPVRRGGPAGDHLEPFVPAGLLLAGVDVATVEADDRGQARAGQRRPVSLPATRPRRDNTVYECGECLLTDLPAASGRRRWMPGRASDACGPAAGSAWVGSARIAMSRLLFRICWRPPRPRPSWR